MPPPAVDGQRVFPSLQRVTIEHIACTAPSAYGLHLPRWDCRSLQQVVVEQAVVASIHYTTVAHILAEASLQPHRSRYWQTARLDEEFVRLAAKVLWCSEHVEWLHRRGELVICMDEKPNLQALRRVAPTHPLGPGRMERREFEYERKGIVHFLVAFNVYDGTMLGGGWTKMIMTISSGACANSSGATPKRVVFICSWTTAAPISPLTPRATSPAARGCGCSTPLPLPRGSIKPSCCCGPLPTSTWTGLTPTRASP